MADQLKCTVVLVVFSTLLSVWNKEAFPQNSCAALVIKKDLCGIEEACWGSFGISTCLECMYCTKSSSRFELQEIYTCCEAVPVLSLPTSNTIHLSCAPCVYSGLILSVCFICMFIGICMSLSVC